MSHVILYKMVGVDLNWNSFLEKGDNRSFSIIYNNHADDLYSYGISLGFDNEICKDAIQDTFYNIYISKDKLHHIKNFTAYIFKSFKHRLIDLAKKESREENIESFNEVFTVDITIIDNIINEEDAVILKKKVQSLLSHLNANQREVIYLRFEIGLGHKEIAEILNIKEESSRKLLYRALEKIRENATKEDLPIILFLLLMCN